MTEIGIVQIDIGLFLIYFAIAAVCIPLVRIMGPVSITSYGLEETYDSDSGFPNVLYRVISPILCCGILTLIVSTALKAAIDFSATYGWAPVLLYWMILIAIKIKNHTMSGKLKPVILELVLSVLISYLFNEFVIAELLKGNVGILDSSNYAIQMELALFYAVIQLIVSLFTRINYQTTYSSARLSRGVSNEKLGLQYYDEPTNCLYQNTREAICGPNDGKGSDSFLPSYHVEPNGGEWRRGERGSARGLLRIIG